MSHRRSHKRDRDAGKERTVKAAESRRSRGHERASSAPPRDRERRPRGRETKSRDRARSADDRKHRKRHKRKKGWKHLKKAGKKIGKHVGKQALEAGEGYLSEQYPEASTAIKTAQQYHGKRKGRRASRARYSAFGDNYMYPVYPSHPTAGTDLVSVARYDAFGDYMDDGYGYGEYQDYDDYNYYPERNQYESASFAVDYDDDEYDDGLDYYYYYILGQNDGYRNRYERRQLLEFGGNGGFMEEMSSWILTGVFVVGFMVLFCAINVIIYRRYRKRKYKTVKMSDIKIAAVMNNEHNGGSSKNAYSLKDNHV